MAAELDGRATPEATAAACRVPTSDALALSRTGVGVRELVAGDVLRARAIVYALGHGMTWTLLDDPRPSTAVALGRCLREGIAAGTLARERIVLGVQLDAGPGFADALAQARANLGAARVDLVVARLGAPLDEVDLDELSHALAALARLVERDEATDVAIAATVGERRDPDALAARLARMAQGPRRGAWLVPMNPVESAAIAPWTDGRRPVTLAAELGIAVIATRPISARSAAGPLRLVETHATEVASALGGLRRLEGAWATGLGRRLRGAEGDAVDLFRWSVALSEAAVHDDAQWQTLRHDVIAPHVGRTAAALLAHLQGDDRDEFAAWWQAYGTALHHAFTAIERARSQVDPAQRIGRAITPLLPAPLHAAPLPVRAVGFALAAGASAVRVGVRTPTEAAALLDALADAPASRSAAELDAVLRSLADPRATERAATQADV